MLKKKTDEKKLIEDISKLKQESVKNILQEDSNAPNVFWEQSEDGAIQFVTKPFAESMTPGELLDYYNLDPEEWVTQNLRVESFWKNLRDESDLDNISWITRFVHSYRGSFAPKATVKEKIAQNWNPFRTPEPAKVTFRNKLPPKIKNPLITKTLILPDPQIGFGFLRDGSSYSLHSTEAMSIALNAARLIQPDKIVNVGDYFDFAEYTQKFLNPQELNGTTQASLEAGHRFLAIQREIANEVQVIEGNHEKRLNDMLLKLAKQLLGVRQAGQPEGWPVLSLPHLLDTDGLGVTWSVGYPGARVYLREDLVVMHGERLSASKQASSDFLFNTVFGHIHRMEVQSKTYERPGREALSTLHISPGCLCRYTGEVPGFGASVGVGGTPHYQIQNWQQGFCVLTYSDEIDSPIRVDLYPITNNMCLVEDLFLVPDREIMEYLDEDSVDAAKKVIEVF